MWLQKDKNMKSGHCGIPENVEIVSPHLMTPSPLSKVTQNFNVLDTEHLSQLMVT